MVRMSSKVGQEDFLREIAYGAYSAAGLVLGCDPRDVAFGARLDVASHRLDWTAVVGGTLWYARHQAYRPQGEAIWRALAPHLLEVSGEPQTPEAIDLLAEELMLPRIFALGLHLTDAAAIQPHATLGTLDRIVIRHGVAGPRNTEKAG